MNDTWVTGATLDVNINGVIPCIAIVEEEGESQYFVTWLFIFLVLLDMMFILVVKGT